MEIIIAFLIVCIAVSVYYNIHFYKLTQHCSKTIMPAEYICTDSSVSFDEDKIISSCIYTKGLEK